MGIVQQTVRRITDRIVREKWLTSFIDVLGGFLSEAGWYDDAEKILTVSHKLCNIREPDECRIACKFLTRYMWY